MFKPPQNEKSGQGMNAGQKKREVIGREMTDRFPGTLQRHLSPLFCVSLFTRN
jgi:hypothetical protein